MQAALGAVPVLGQKGIRLKKHIQKPQCVLGRGVVDAALCASQRQSVGHIDLKKLLSPRTCALPIQAPDRAIGQYAPLDGAVGSAFNTAQIPQHLGRWRIGVVALGGIAPVERAQPALGF